MGLKSNEIFGVGNPANFVKCSLQSDIICNCMDRRNTTRGVGKNLIEVCGYSTAQRDINRRLHAPPDDDDTTSLGVPS
jgi:hypothetical protein